MATPANSTALPPVPPSMQALQTAMAAPQIPQDSNCLRPQRSTGMRKIVSCVYSRSRVHCVVLWQRGQVRIPPGPRGFCLRPYPKRRNTPPQRSRGRGQRSRPAGLCAQSGPRGGAARIGADARPRPGSSIILSQQQVRPPRTECSKVVAADTERCLRSPCMGTPDRRCPRRSVEGRR